MRDTCTHRAILARAPKIQIDRCGCGTIQLSMASVTLRIDERSLEALHATVGEALDTLARAKVPEPPGLRLVDAADCAEDLI